MGNCCNASNNDNDIENNQRSNKVENKKNKREFSSLDFQNPTRYNTGTENIHKEATDYSHNKIVEQHSSKSPSKMPQERNIYISKKRLKLVIKQSKCLEEGKEYIINSAGLVDNKEGPLDGLTIFGDTDTNTRTDFIFPEEESNTKQNHAEIRYDRTLDLYQIKSLRGNGCFLKIDTKILLKSDDLFSFSTFMLQVKIDIKSEEINNSNTVIASILSIEVLFGEEKRRKISFDSRKKQMIRIGRIKNDETDFVFEDEDVSRKQCMIIFEDNNWYIVDGNGINPSSNGTWLYPEKHFNISEGLIIRMGTTLFECKYIQDP